MESALVERFAQELDAQVEWVDGAEAELIAALHLHQLDIVVGGLTADTPYQDQAAITRPYLITETVLAAPIGRSAPPSFAGVEVQVEAGSEAAGLVQRLDAVPVGVSDIAQARGFAAVDEWLLDDLGYSDTGQTLARADHVMAVPLGENGWQVRLERFLFANLELADELLAREGHP